MQHLAKLERWLARFEIDDETNADTAHRRKLCLFQLLRFAFTAHEESKRGAVHITERDIIESGSDFASKKFPNGNIEADLEKSNHNIPDQEYYGFRQAREEEIGE